jgi:hypothetical protein
VREKIETVAFAKQFRSKDTGDRGDRDHGSAGICQVSVVFFGFNSFGTTLTPIAAAIPKAVSIIRKSA